MVPDFVWQHLEEDEGRLHKLKQTVETSANADTGQIRILVIQHTCGPAASQYFCSLPTDGFEFGVTAKSSTDHHIHLAFVDILYNSAG